MIKLKRKHKIFCIGSGKTGTTSLEKALRDLGYKLGDQPKGEMLLSEYANRNFGAIIRFCESAEAFQDAPFCFQHTYMALDQHYKNAKFILTMRKSDDHWYKSFKNSHVQKFGGGERVPTWNDLRNVAYRYKGYVAEVRKKVFGLSEKDDPYDEEKLKRYYNVHNASVLDYFKNKDNLLIIDVAEDDAYLKLCKFLGKKPKYDRFPWEHKTSEIG